MKKRVSFVIIIIIAIAVGSVIVLKMKSADNEKKSSGVSLGQQFDTACEVLTPEKAKTVLGELASKEEGPSDGKNASSNDIALSNCTYHVGKDTQSIAAVKTLDVVIRSPRNDSGVAANKAVFSARPDKTADVAGYGDAAFWNEEFAQLNVLVKDDWYVIQYGSEIPTNRNLEDTKKAAEILLR